MGYRHLSIEEREVIMVEREKGTSQREIGRQLGRNASSINRELKRNDSARGYRASQAQERALKNRKQPRRSQKMEYEPLKSYVEEKLRSYWSPEQIAGRLKQEQTVSCMRVCHETIYQFIMESAKNGLSYEAYLRQGHRRHSYGYRGKSKYKRIRDVKRIEQRPVEANERSRWGDWESDTLRGPQRQSVGLATHVDRKTRYLLLALLPDRKAKTYNQKTQEAFEARPELPRRTFTVDNGMEFSEFKALEAALATQVYFATPYHAWERGTNENTNGLLRQFFPKGRDLSGVHPREVQQVEDLINNRPRKGLGYRTPNELTVSEIVALGN